MNLKQIIAFSNDIFVDLQNSNLEFKSLYEKIINSLEKEDNCEIHNCISSLERFKKKHEVLYKESMELINIAEKLLNSHKR